MGLFSGLKKLGRGLGTGFKQAGSGIGGKLKSAVKGFDKFDDWIKLKEIAQIGQFIPGVNVFAKPLAMTYAGFDVAKGVKEGNLMKAALAGASMYGSSKIDTGGIGSWGEVAGGGLGPTRGFRNALQDNITGNLKNYAGGFSNPLGLMDKYAGLDKGSKFAIGTLAPPILSKLQGGQKKPQGPIPSYGYQPMNYGPSQGFSPTSQFPTQAQGGITGDDKWQRLSDVNDEMKARAYNDRLAKINKDKEEGILPPFRGKSVWPSPGISDLPYGPHRDYAGELGIDQDLYDEMLNARIYKMSRELGPTQRDMDRMEAESHGWLEGPTPQDLWQKFKEKTWDAEDRGNTVMARGGITGDDWHQPINRLPANYEGWVTQPSLATLGEAGKEAVLPLNKLLPAMNKGGLNYSPGQAIVGEAGPEYVTRLGPGEEQYAQRILQERPMPQMANGGVAGEPSYWDQLRDFDWVEGRDNLRDWGGRTGKDIMEWGSEEDPGEWKKRAMGFMHELASGAFGKSMGALYGLGLNPMNLITGQGNWFGETLGEGRLGPGRGAFFGPGTPYKDRQEYERSRDAILDPLEERIFSAEEGSEEREQAEEEYYERLEQIEAEERNTIGQMTAEQGGRDVIVPPGMSEIEMVQAMQRGEKFPPVAGPLPPYVGPQGLDPALLDNYNAREWQRRAETSPEDKKRYEGMLQDLIQRQNEGEVFPTPTYSATALDKLVRDDQEGEPGGLTREQQIDRSRADQDKPLIGGDLLTGVDEQAERLPPNVLDQLITTPRLDRYPSEEEANIGQQAPQAVPPQQFSPEVVPGQQQAPPVVPGQEQVPHVERPQEIQEETLYKPAEIAQMLIQRGMDPRSAAHMAANIMQESGGWVGKGHYEDLSVSGRGGTSGGIVSWRDATKPGGGRDPEGRLTRIENHYGRKIQNITLQEQLDYMMKEMQDEYWQEGDKRYKTGTWDVLRNPNATQDQRFGAMKNYLGYGIEGEQRNPAYHGAALQQFSGGRPFVPDFADLDFDLEPNMQTAHQEATPGALDSIKRWIGF